jgi:putative transposase
LWHFDLSFPCIKDTTKRPKIVAGDHILWSSLSRRWRGWRDALVIVQTGTVISCQRKRFRDHWTKLSRSGKSGRPQVPEEIKQLIRKIPAANISWGSPRIVGELRKLGIDVANSTVEKYRVRHSKPPSSTWRTFLNIHFGDLVAIDFFVVPTVKNKVLFVLVVLAHHRRQVVHFNVTEHPTAQWTGQQIIEAFPWDTAPTYLLRDRDAIYGSRFRRRVHSLGIEEVITAPRSPWQNAYIERIIGSIRRECLDQVVVLNERHLKRILTTYFKYYHCWRTHLSLDMDRPRSRSVQSPALGKVIQVREVGGLHHHYEGLAA